MRAFLDTNVVLSAMLFPRGVAASCYVDAVAHHDTVISDYVLAEVRAVVSRKFPDRHEAVEQFIETLIATVEVVATTAGAEPDEYRVRDPKDRPILRAARAARCEVIVTGDKDLLEAGISHPWILSPGDWPTGTSRRR